MFGYLISLRTSRMNLRKFTGGERMENCNSKKEHQSLVFGYLAIITLQLPCRKEKCEINKAKWYFGDDFSN